MPRFPDDHTPRLITAYFADPYAQVEFVSQFKPGPVGAARGWLPVPPYRTAVTMRNVRRALAHGVTAISVRCGTREADFQVADLMVHAVPAGAFLAGPCTTAA